MKLVAAWLVVLGLAAAMATSCSINHRSGDFTCTSTPECGSGRVCSDGLCVVTGSGIDAGSNHPIIDSPITPPDAAPSCPAECTSCEDGMICHIDCAVPGASCSGAMRCPAGWNCEIGCTQQDNCNDNIDCSDAASCTIACSGRNTCRNLDCGDGRCKVDCSGPGSCRAMSCVDSCACDIQCHPSSACQDLTCSHNDTCGGQFWCTSQGEGCDTCQ